MRLGVNVVAGGFEPAGLVSMARRAEELGFDSVWTGEAYGSDAVVPLTWIAANTSRIAIGTGIMQLAARTPAMTAMTAMTLDAMSGGRLRLGLGVSGPQVVEGWHGQPYGKPLERTREYVEIVRRIWRRERLTFEGSHYSIPYRGPDATNLGTPLKSMLPAARDIPLYLAAVGPKNMRLATEVAQGALPLFWSPEHWRGAFGDAFDRVDLATFDLCPSVLVAIGDDVAACRDSLKPFIALYVGGMGASSRNFYNDLIWRYGYESAAEAIQAAYLDGRRQDAVAAVPDALVDELALVGPTARIRDRLAAWSDGPVRTMVLNVTSVRDLEAMAEAAA
jgi:F420-dependent oxidoreductase-like protein